MAILFGLLKWMVQNIDDVLILASISVIAFMFGNDLLGFGWGLVIAIVVTACLLIKSLLEDPDLKGVSHWV